MSRAIHVTVTDPDNPHGSPAYDGDDTDAYRTLEPGAYAATTELDTEVRLVVTDTSSRVR